MPYTPHAERRVVARARSVDNVGNLTYDLQQLVQDYLLSKVADDPEGLLRYQYLSEAKAALLGCYDDLQVRVVTPYEERKCRENGDVWSPILTGEA